ncbi:hypothetical protein A7978_04735 (plasmid) [Borrelia turicatae]|uniref:Lipoprotein n=2 Tax=Borrelia turicatae TaxID=142 RepID=T1ECN5_BORT9|nr:hypothetical protein [Borrelia turicatae]ADN26506.1 hypothetical protein BTA077 [Borrelia turicatae 91E135]ANF34419.1 hypothetical protein A7978_04735 [Borrelia turicatae]UPA14003.1 hypothetical protein bt91E135_001167 [Borrelia turicatae 91E135]UPA15496.1 hypothetical protein btBTE5EL_001178 [Borrelia turicatae]
MVVKKLILKLLFAVGLLVFFNACTKESQDFAVSYSSNDNSSLRFELKLVNNSGSLALLYSSYSNLVNIYFKLKSEDSIYLKTIELDGSFIHINDEDEYLTKHPINVFSKNVRAASVFFDFNRCKDEWKNLIADSNDGYLKFSVICVEEESKLEKKYEFRVSAVNLSKFMDILQ